MSTLKPFLLLTAVFLFPHLTARGQTPLCNVKTQPSLSAIASAVTATSGTSFVTDYNVLSQGAWCTFIALNWAALGSAPTMTGDPKKAIGTCTQGSQNCQVVWETWTDSDNVFQPNGAVPAVCGTGGLKAKTPLVHRLIPVTPNQVKSFRPGALAGSSQGIDEFRQATGFQLPDKNNSSTNPSVFLYEVRENPSTVGTICTNKLYNLDGQYAFYQAQKPPAAGLPPNPGFQFSGSAFEVKPAWYAVPGSNSEPDTLGMLTAQGACSSGVTCGQTGNLNIGLGGLHILWKVFNNSTWYWMTFQYVNPSGTDNTTVAPVLKTQLANAYLPAGKSPRANFGAFPPSSPQPASVATAAQTANGVFLPMLKGTRLANYQLVGVQVVPVLGGTNTILANNVIETDFGSPNYGGTSLNPSSSCISCHYAASIGPLTQSPCSLGRINFFAGATDSGLQGAFTPSIYATSGPFVSSDFVWTMRKAQWSNTGSGCPPAASSSKAAPKKK